MLKNIFLGVVLPLILVISGFAVFFGLQSPPPPQSTLPQPVVAELLPYMPKADVAQVRALAEKSETLDIAVSGTVVPYRELQLAAETAGRIIEKDPRVRSGNYVQKGQVLYRIDPRDYELEVDRLTQRHAQELAVIEELKQEIENSKRLVVLADEEFVLAEADLNRFKELGTKFASPAELDKARRSRLSSMNQRVTLQNQLSTYEGRISRMEIAAKLAETELEQANINLERTVVRAPVDGRVVSEQVETDSYVQRGANLVLIEDMEKVEVACNIRMDQLYWILDQPNLSTDQLVNAAQATRYELPPTPVEVGFEVAGRNSIKYRWKGVLDRFDGAGLDPQSRTVPIRVRVENPSDFLVLGGDGSALEIGGPPMLVRGMFIDLVIHARPATQLLLVPKLSIKPASQENVIWKFTPNQNAVYETPTAKASLAAAQKAKDLPKQISDAAKLPAGPADSSRTVANPDDWEIGYLEIVKDARMVVSYWGAEQVEYWVCEVPAGRLAPGDLVITTPLPGIKADGKDPVRVKASAKATDSPNLIHSLKEGPKS